MKKIGIVGILFLYKCRTKATINENLHYSYENRYKCYSSINLWTQQTCQSNRNNKGNALCSDSF